MVRSVCFSSVLESSHNVNPIEITWRKNGTFSLFETSVNDNVTFAYIMTFHCTSVLLRVCSSSLI